jgi:hypothetical protein
MRTYYYSTVHQDFTERTCLQKGDFLKDTSGSRKVPAVMLLTEHLKPQAHCSTAYAESVERSQIVT